MTSMHSRTSNAWSNLRIVLGGPVDTRVRLCFARSLLTTVFAGCLLGFYVGARQGIAAWYFRLTRGRFRVHRTASRGNTHCARQDQDHQNQSDRIGGCADVINEQASQLREGIKEALVCIEESIRSARKAKPVLGSVVSMDKTAAAH